MLSPQGPRGIKIDASGRSGFVRRLFFPTQISFDKIFSHGRHWERAPGSGCWRTVPARWPAAGRILPSSRSPPIPAPRLAGLPLPPPVAQKSHAHAQGTPMRSGHYGGQCWVLGVQGCSCPSPAALPTFSPSRVPGASPRGRPALGTLSAECLSLWERHQNSRRTERNGKGLAGALQGGGQLRPGQGQGARSQRPGHWSWAGQGVRAALLRSSAQRPSWVSVRALLCRQRPLTSIQCRSRPSLPCAVWCGWGRDCLSLPPCGTGSGNSGPVCILR